MNPMVKDITVRTRIIGLCVRALELPLLVRFRFCLFFICLQEQVFWHHFAYFLEEIQGYGTRHMVQLSKLLRYPTLDFVVLAIDF